MADAGQKRTSMGGGVSAKADKSIKAKKPVSMFLINSCAFGIAGPFREHEIQSRASAFPAAPLTVESLRGSHRSSRHVYRRVSRVHRIFAPARDLFLTPRAALRKRA